MTFLEHFLSSMASHYLRASLARFSRGRPRKRQAIKRFKDEFLSGYKHFPEKGPSRYLARHDHKPNDNELETYHFFIDPAVALQEFKAFLIPPLDSGHRLNEKSRQERIGRVHLTLDKSWSDYLHGIGLKATQSLEKGPFDGCRIVFFDRELLLFFLENSEWIITENSKWVVAEADGEKARATRLAGLAHSAVRYASNIIAIHEIMMIYYKGIKCRYYDKGEIKTTDYFDFGYYKIEGVPVIYTPIYQKNIRKGIREERVLIGDKFSHQDGIQDYLRSFDQLWNWPRCALEAADQEQLMRSDVRPPDTLLKPEEYEHYATLTLEFFDKTYFAALNNIFKDHPELKG